VKNSRKWDYVISDDERKLYHYMEDVSPSHLWEERVLKGRGTHPMLRSLIVLPPRREDGRRHFTANGYRPADISELFAGTSLRP
jgi:hypothetical protein